MSGRDTLTSQTVKLARVASERFDEYVIVGKLGHGGMAEVFLAFQQGHRRFRKLLVIKRLLAHLHDEPEMLRMFHDEARLAARLNHPHVVQTNKVGVWEGHHFMAMEYLEGQPLSKVLRRVVASGERLSPSLAARVVGDVLDGLEYAHELTDFDGTPLQIVHRDVSPQNIFVTYDGAVKLLDFGIAKAETSEAVTRTGLVKGKFAYIAPEQADGARVDRRADVWSVGVVLWEALTGRRLFKSHNELATLNEALTKEIVPPHRVVEGIPERLSEIAMGALQRDRSLRYPAAGHMKEDLDEWLARAAGAGSRRNLSRFMKEHFADTLEEQRALVKSCIARVDEVAAEQDAEETPTLVADPTGAFRTRAPAAAAAVSDDAEAPVSVSVQRPIGDPAFDRRRWQLSAAVILLFAIVGGVAAMFGPWSGDATPGGGAGASGALQVASVEGVRSDAPPSPADEGPSAADRGAADRGAAAEDVADDEGSPTAAGPGGSLTAAEPSDAASAAGPEGDDDPARDTRARYRTEPDGDGRAGARRRARPRRHVRSPRRERGARAGEARASAATTPAATAPATGRLTLDTQPWSEVTLDGRRLGMTPLVNVELPAGTHLLRLSNPELGVSTTYRVTVPEDDSVTRRLVIE